MRKFPRKQRPRSIHAHGLEQGQFKPQLIRNRRIIDEEPVFDPDDILLDPDWDLE